MCWKEDGRVGKKLISLEKTLNVEKSIQKVWNEKNKVGNDEMKGCDRDFERVWNKNVVRNGIYE